MTERFDAWWLPEASGDIPLEVLQIRDLEFRYPLPTPALMERTARTLRRAGRSLAERPVAEIVAAIDRAARRLGDPADPLRQEAERMVGAATGYSAEMTTLVLDRMTADWRAGPLERLLEAELGGQAPLDGFAAAGENRRSRAYGPRLAFHVFAGNVPGVAVTSLIRTLLVKAPSVGKLASGQPVLPVLFARALDSVDAEIARALAITYWPGGDRTAEWQLLEAADLVVVYGGADATASFRDRLPPGNRLVLHGPRFSVGMIGFEALEQAGLPDRVARAVATFDQHGCVSPQAIWVEEPDGTDSRKFADALAAAFGRLEVELPRGRIDAAESSAIHQERGAAEMRSHHGSTRVMTGAGTSWTVIHEEEPMFRPSCLNRFLHVHPVAALEDVPDLLAPYRDRLQSVALACDDRRRADLAHSLARAGATRITSFDRVPWPPPEWHHDGRGPLLELLRWVDLEE